MSNYGNSRRKFIKAAVYTVPVVMTLRAAPSFAKSGSNISGISCEHDDSTNTLKCKNSAVTHVFNIPQSKNGLQRLIASFLKIFGLG